MPPVMVPGSLLPLQSTRKSGPARANRHKAPSLPALHIGIDEAGRGCLAGPVVAAAVLLPPQEDCVLALAGLTDSKALTKNQRDDLAPRIRSVALAFGVGFAWQREVDAVNVLNATFRAMSRACFALAKHIPAASQVNAQALPLLAIDGPHCIPPAQWAYCANKRAPSLPLQIACVGGDASVLAIAAASVLAKTVRDRLLEQLDARFPAYGFAKHKGYGTQSHLAVLAEQGPCPLHRMSFQPLRGGLSQGLLLEST